MSNMTVFLAFAFDMDDIVFGLGRFGGLKVGLFSKVGDQSRRVYVPLTAQHHLEDW
jgi:hypothetical protein